MDLSFFAANLFKIPEGGWSPLLVGLLIFRTMTTWQPGREVVRTFLRRGEAATSDFVASLTDHPQPRVKGTAVYMFPDVDRVPPALLTNLRANQFTPPDRGAAGGEGR